MVSGPITTLPKINSNKTHYVFNIGQHKIGVPNLRKYDVFLLTLKLEYPQLYKYFVYFRFEIVVEGTFKPYHDIISKRLCTIIYPKFLQIKNEYPNISKMILEIEDFEASIPLATTKNVISDEECVKDQLDKIKF